MNVNIVLVACVCRLVAGFANVLCEATEKETDWVPSTVFGNTSVVVWSSVREDANASVKTKAASGRAFNDYHLDSADRAFEYSEFVDRDDSKAVPYTGSEQTTSASSGSGPYLNPKPPATAAAAAQQFFGTPLHSYSSQPLTHPHDGYQYSAPQYLPPPSTGQHLENLDSYLPTQSFSNGSHGSDANSKNLLYVQPGKCSNSIEVGRVRDVEVKTVFKYGTDNPKGVCVLMLYAANEFNKLAVSLQAVQGTNNIIPTGSWLETNVKMYAVQAGTVQPVFTKSNFGPNSPALILTKSNIVLLSFYVDRALDFFLDISTYQSPTCR